MFRCFRIWCVALLVNLTVRDALDWDFVVAELVRKVKEIVSYLKRYVKQQATLEDCQDNNKKARLKLVQSVCTRWNSELDMLDRFAVIFPEVSTVITGRKEAPDMVSNSNLEMIQVILKQLKLLKLILIYKNVELHLNSLYGFFSSGYLRLVTISEVIPAVLTI